MCVATPYVYNVSLQYNRVISNSLARMQIIASSFLLSKFLIPLGPSGTQFLNKRTRDIQDAGFWNFTVPAQLCRNV